MWIVNSGMVVVGTVLKTYLIIRKKRGESMGRMERVGWMVPKIY